MIISQLDHDRFMTVLERLQGESNARFVFLLDKAGQHIATAGELDDVDPTSLASLAAGNVAATEGVAQLVGEQEFTSQYHEGAKDSLHISVVGRTILLVVFDERSSLGLVRLRVDQVTPDLASAVSELEASNAAGGKPTLPAAAFEEITEADIDSLFS